MSLYRLYFRDREGHFSAVREIEAYDAAQAIGRADRICDGGTCELWQENRLLKRWDARES